MKAEKPKSIYPSRKRCVGIIKRFLKDTQNILWSRELPTLYRLFKKYPSAEFWENYNLPFGNNKLNHMSWFESVEGQIELPRAFMLFHYRPSEEESDEKPFTLDIEVESDYTESVPEIKPKKPSTMSELLSSKPDSK